MRDSSKRKDVAIYAKHITLRSELEILMPRVKSVIGKIVACLCLLSPTTVAIADEVDALIRQIQPPARFAKYKPDFSVERRQFTFEYYSGQRTVTHLIVKDGPRYVALMPLPSGTIYMLDFNPDTAPTKLQISSDRRTMERLQGTILATDAYIPTELGENESHVEFTKGDGTLTLVRQFKGTVTFNKWAHRSKTPETVEETNTFVLRCDPVLGYLVEGTYRTKVKPAPDQFQYFNTATTGICNVWSTDDTVSRVVLTPTYKEGFAGYGLNFAAIDLSDNDKSRCTVRDGGFAGFLNSKTGWSPVNTIEGSTAKLVVCNAHADLDFIVPWTQSNEDADCFSHNLIKTRLLALPPEITRYVWDNMSIRFENAKRVMIRIGVMEDFEDQPLPLTSGVRGLTSTGGGPKVTDLHAYSGRQSIVIPHGRFWPNLPQVPLVGGKRYRLSAWIKLVPWTTEQRAAEADKIKEKIERQKARGKQADEFRGFGTPEAYITADTYVSSPHLKE